MKNHMSHLSPWVECINSNRQAYLGEVMKKALLISVVLLSIFSLSGCSPASVYEAKKTDSEGDFVACTRYMAFLEFDLHWLDVDGTTLEEYIAEADRAKTEISQQDVLVAIKAKSVVDQSATFARGEMSQGAFNAYLQNRDSLINDCEVVGVAAPISRRLVTGKN